MSTDTFQYVVEMDTLKVFVMLAAQNGHLLLQTDVNSAFLQGTLKEPAYAHSPRGPKASLDEDDNKEILKIRGNLHGPKTTPRMHGEMFDARVLSFPKEDDAGNRTELRTGRADHSTWHFLRTGTSG